MCATGYASAEFSPGDDCKMHRQSPVAHFIQRAGSHFAGDFRQTEQFSAGDNRLVKQAIDRIVLR
jgi:hypothetical protein